MDVNNLHIGIGAVIVAVSWGIANTWKIARIVGKFDTSVKVLELKVQTLTDKVIDLTLKVNK